MSLFPHMQLYPRDFGKFKESQLPSGKYQKLAVRALVAVEVVFGMLVCLYLGLSRILLFLNPWFFFFGRKKRGKEGKKEKKKGRNKERKKGGREGRKDCKP